VGVVLVLLVVALALGLGDDGGTASSPLDGKPAPVLAGQTLDGRRFDLADLRGSWVVVNFFSTNCVPCKLEHPELVTFAGRHAGAGDRYVVSVVFDDTPEEVAEFFARQGGDWPVVIDRDGAAAVEWSVTAVPESIIVAPSGVVVTKVKGGVRAEELDRFIDDIEAAAGVSSP
jgi:cytochrome c biogenesis protein CcmG/thiol:disulfide interchange protein DsbE